MPRNGSGVYSLVAGNPVVTNTTIATAWANPTLSDIATALTNSLDRTGLGGMLAPFRVFDGTLALPGLAFLNEVGLGIWRPGNGLMQLVAGGVGVLNVEVGGVSIPVELQFLSGSVAILKSTGFHSWKVDNQDGFLTFTPSESVDDEDWAPTKRLTIDSLGQLRALQNAQFDSTIAAAAGTFTAFDAITATITDLIAARIEANSVENVPVIQNAVGAINLDWNLAQVAHWTITGVNTITPINVPADNTIRVVLNATNAGATTWAASVRWPLGVTPNLTAGTLKKAVVDLTYDGTHYLGFARVY